LAIACRGGRDLLMENITVLTFHRNLRVAAFAALLAVTGTIVTTATFAPAQAMIFIFIDTD